MPQPTRTQTPVICIGGATGTGKTELAISIATRLNGSIINADSRQFYKDFPIITAQPDAEEQKAAPHRLYGTMLTDEKLSAGKYARIAKTEITHQINEGKTPILVGGTGLYFKALLQGIAPIPDIPPDIHQKWIRKYIDDGGLALHQLLAANDRQAAARIHPNDRQRLTRALEVFDATGKSISDWHASEDAISEYHYFFIGIDIPLQQLEKKLKLRIDKMLAAGAVEEAKAAYRHNSNFAAPGWSGIGCAELYKYISGQMDLAQACELWLKNTRSYAKRQLTWFRGDKSMSWFSPDNLQAATLAACAWHEEQNKL